MTDCAEQVKRVAAETEGTPAVKLVAVLMAQGITSTAELSSIVGIGSRAVRRIKAGLQTRVYSSARAYRPGYTVPPGPTDPSSLTRASNTTRANLEYPSGIVLEDKNPPGGRAREAENPNELARRAYEQGLAVKGGMAAKSLNAVRRSKGELDGSKGITFADGQLTVVNGKAAELAKAFPGIDLAAVCDRAGPDIARMSYPSADDAMAVLRKWARILSDKPGGKAPAKLLPPSPRRQISEEDFEAQSAEVTRQLVAQALGKA